MKQEFSHQPVLLDEVLEGLAIQADGVYVDGTFGRGGHASAILAELGTQGRLLAMDKDPEAVLSAEQQFSADPRFELVAPHPFALVVFRLVAGDDATSRLARALNDSGKVAVTPTTLGDATAIRISIGSTNTTAAHVAALWDLIDQFI